MNQIYKINLPNIIIYFSVFTEIIPVIFYLLYSKNDKRLRVIFFLLIINFLTDIYGIYSLANLKSNFISFNAYQLIETICISFFYKEILDYKYINKIITAIISLFFIFWIFEFIKLGKTEFLYNCITIENIFIIVFAVFYYIEQIIQLNKNDLYVSPQFWVVTAFFISAAGTFFLLLYIPSVDFKNQFKYYNFINYIFVIIRNILLAVAMFMKTNVPEKQKIKQTKSGYY